MYMVFSISFNKVLNKDKSKIILGTSMNNAFQGIQAIE